MEKVLYHPFFLDSVDPEQRVVYNLLSKRHRKEIRQIHGTLARYNPLRRIVERVDLVEEAFHLAFSVGLLWPPDLCRVALQTNASLQVIQRAHSLGCLFSLHDYPPSHWYLALSSGRIDVIEWIASQYPHISLSSQCCAHAAFHGKGDVLRWLRTQECPWDVSTTIAAAEGGHVDLLQWLRSQGCPWNTWVCARAALRGHLNALQWAKTHGCPWDAWTTICAAIGGHMDLLKWAHRQGCPSCHLVLMRAVDYGHWEMVKWLRTQVPPFPWSCGTPTQTRQRCVDFFGEEEVLSWENVE